MTSNRSYLTALNECLEGYQERPQQMEMLDSVQGAFNNNRIALIEAGTGTGKSLAYLIPAIIWALERGERVVVSTKTINLQEQLLHKDLPLVAKAIGQPFNAVLVKGMGNYICYRKLSEVADEDPDDQLQQIAGWAGECPDGTKSSLPFKPSAAIWERVNAERETCTNKRCPHYKECPFFRERKKAEDAHILVVNHALLFADLALQEGGEDGILPAYTRLIIDEAHHIEDVATELFAAKISRTDLLHTMGKIASEKGGRLPLFKRQLMRKMKLEEMEKYREVLQLLDIDLPHERRILLDKLSNCFDTFIEFALEHKMQDKLRLREMHFQSDVWREDITEGAMEFIQAVDKFITTLLSLHQEVARIEESVPEPLKEALSFAERLKGSASILKRFLDEQKDGRVRWIEEKRLGLLNNLLLVDANLDVSELLVEGLFKKFKTVVLCSATLSTGQNFNFIKGRLGLNHLNNVDEHIYDSPFDYEKQMLIAVPKDLPNPNEPEFFEKAKKALKIALKVTSGHAFVLFTSYKMMQQMAEYFREYPLFVQGEGHRSSLLSQFKTTPNAVLFGTDSFWEGVDVVGDALRQVVIVKLPFKVPSEPLVQARGEWIAATGGDPFFDYSLPHAIVKLKQGIGRLIRHQNDRGLVLVLDRRLVTKGYGATMMKSLPSTTTQTNLSMNLYSQHGRAFLQRGQPLVTHSAQVQ